ncbi:uncharacterized protein PHALS_00449 [Plasmopara halstedii]|uniref:Uncharacterized protein n=1 Tax=Plasmopara halstedii TaxID=4781 RepID=A0A0N7L3K5_PLAHL|nr:uncharacterized protein PHALS_00449 [Plasmopara halstedii]CEG36131.1 hypothetical protein PHALS_00449 [Plasmopara halstedii]|eukprot:XP_024572500.1 hypothetical protein PHALS_00449 [Plasmopara halstedii]
MKRKIPTNFQIERSEHRAKDVTTVKNEVADVVVSISTPSTISESSFSPNNVARETKLWKDDAKKREVIDQKGSSILPNDPINQKKGEINNSQIKSAEHPVKDIIGIKEESANGKTTIPVPSKVAETNFPSNNVANETELWKDNNEKTEGIDQEKGQMLSQSSDDKKSKNPTNSQNKSAEHPVKEFIVVKERSVNDETEFTVPSMTSEKVSDQNLTSISTEAMDAIKSEKEVLKALHKKDKDDLLTAKWVAVHIENKEASELVSEENSSEEDAQLIDKDDIEDDSGDE